MFDVTSIRSQFPALGRIDDGLPAAYLDGPGGTQTPQRVIDAMSTALSEGVSNLGGGFPPSDLAGDITEGARRAMADLYNCDPGEVVFGQNMTSLTFALSHALAATWKDGDAILLTDIDHDANFTPWARAAEERGVDVRVARFDPKTGLLDPTSVTELIDEKVRLVAVAYSSNALGTVVDLEPIVEAAHSTGALVFVDAVHAGPHHLVDVQELGCDFLASSVYKFFGPHTGVLYGRADLLASLDAYKVRPAPSDPPGKWETGTQSYESLAGVTAAVDYVASLGSSGNARRESLADAYSEIERHERSLGERFISGVHEIRGAKLWGVQQMSRQRCATFAVTIDGASPKDVTAHLASRSIYAWAGHYYAVNLMERLGVLDKGGLVRIGFVHYNTAEEVDRCMEALAEI